MVLHRSIECTALTVQVPISEIHMYGNATNQELTQLRSLESR
jgi:hypothetical protein